MTRIITISDDVYRKLVREKGDRSFSEVIADHLEAGAAGGRRRPGDLRRRNLRARYGRRGDVE